jgi:flagellar FliJ protein
MMPPPFRFSLQRILDLRTQQEEQAQAELARAQSEHMVQQHHLERLRQDLDASAWQGGSSEGQGGAELWLWLRYRERILHDIDATAARVEELARKVERCRAELVERSKERQKLEKLRSQRAMRYYEEHRAREQKELDEMAGLYHQKGPL